MIESGKAGENVMTIEDNGHEQPNTNPTHIPQERPEDTRKALLSMARSLRAMAYDLSILAESYPKESTSEEELRASPDFLTSRSESVHSSR